MTPIQKLRAIVDGPARPITRLEIDQIVREMEQKFPDSDAAVQIAEEAFKAGWDEGRQYLYARDPNHQRNENEERALHAAWSEFEPSEACKELLK